MYLEYFGLTESPFRITPHTEFFFSGANRGATLAALLYAITHDEGIVKVSGEVGSGKTMLCRVLMERLPESVVTLYLANPSLSAEDILFSIADELELTLPDDTRISAVVRALQTRLIELHGLGHQVVVLIDEAHAMPEATLEEIRLLSNLETGRHKLLQLVLFGQPELDEVLCRQQMRPLRERITQSFNLEPLHQSDIARYLDFRMRMAGYRGPEIFSEAAVARIAKASQGLTRRVNILADKSLLAAYAESSHQITPTQVDAAIRDAGYEGGRTGRWRWALPAGVAALAVLIVAALARQTETGMAMASAAAPTAADVVSRPETSAAGLASQTNNNTARPKTTIALEQRVDDTRDWLGATGGDRWFVQLVTIDARQAGFAQAYLAKAAGLLPAEHVRAYQGGSEGDRRIGIIYGNFASKQAASDAIRQLPAELSDNNPFPRQVRWLK